MSRDPKALFESWRGSYADSPREISLRLGEARPDVRRVWVGETGFPADVDLVKRHSPRYFAHLAGCDLVIANDIITKQLVKGPRVTYLQCWHGTPIKLLGHDETKAAYTGHAAHMKRLRRDVAHWDALLSPSAEITEIFRSAFGYDGEVWETGYPRNDPLRSPDADSVRARVRSDLGLDPHEVAVLWAPTWRDDERDETGRLAAGDLLDLDQVMRLTPQGTRMLVRLHKNVAVGRPGTSPSGVIDVSTHPEISELYLAADVLVSDYSSAVYDFAVTGKPMIMFVPDLERYRDSTRGLYFDYEEWAPGPLATSAEELADRISAVPGLPEEHASRLAAFRERFCPHEDGRATQRVIERLLAISGL